MSFVRASAPVWARATESKELAVRAGKRKRLKLLPRDPPARLILRQTAVERDPVSFQRHSIARDGVFYHTHRLEAGGEGLEHKLCNSIQGDGVCGQFRIWELPKMGVDHASRSLAHEKTTAILGDKGGEPSGRRRDGAAQIGNCFDTAGSAGRALSDDWAEITLWLRRRTD